MQTKYRSKPIFNLAPIVCCKHSAKLSYTSHHNKKKKDETKNHRIAAPTAELELSQIPTFWGEVCQFRAITRKKKLQKLSG